MTLTWSCDHPTKTNSYKEIHFSCFHRSPFLRTLLPVFITENSVCWLHNKKPSIKSPQSLWLGLIGTPVVNCHYCPLQVNSGYTSSIYERNKPLSSLFTQLKYDTHIYIQKYFLSKDRGPIKAPRLSPGLMKLQCIQRLSFVWIFLFYISS